MIEVDLSSKKLRSLATPLSPEVSVIINQSRKCLSYNLRLKREDEDRKMPPHLVPKKQSKGVEAYGPLICVGYGLLILPELTDFEHSYDDEIIPVSYADPGLIEKKNWYAMRAFEYSGPLMKVGRSSKRWITRWHVLKNYTLLVY